jgi:hypothetical protein
MSSTTVTRGNLHESFIMAVPFTPAALSSAQTTSYQTVAVQGLSTSDIVEVLGYTGAQTTGVATGKGYVSANNVLSVQFLNLIGTALTPAAGSYLVRVDRLEGPAPTNAA